jgi:hypothetical protein
MKYVCSNCDADCDKPSQCSRCKAAVVCCRCPPVCCAGPEPKRLQTLLCAVNGTRALALARALARSLTGGACLWPGSIAVLPAKSCTGRQATRPCVRRRRRWGRRPRARDLSRQKRLSPKFPCTSTTFRRALPRQCQSACSVSRERNAAAAVCPLCLPGRRGVDAGLTLARPRPACEFAGLLPTLACKRRACLPLKPAAGSLLANRQRLAFAGKQVDGVWHTGVVVFGKEFFFGGGIQSGDPGQTPYGTPVERYRPAPLSPGCPSPQRY